MGRVTRCLGVALVALTLSGSALADRPEARANALYNEGKALLEAGEHAEAVETFTRAWGIFEHPLILKKRAEAFEGLLEYEKALTDYREYVSRLPTRKRAERREVLEHIQALEAMVQKPVQITVVTSRARVLVSVDGAAPQAAPFEVALVPGEHSVRIQDPRFTDDERRITVRPGRPEVVTLDPAPRKGQLQIVVNRQSLAGVTIELDGAPVEIEDESSPRLPPRALVVGAHRVTCRAPGVPDATNEVQVVEGRVATATCQLAEPLPPVAADPWGWVTASAGLAATAAGVGLLVSYFQDVDLAESRGQDLKSSKHIAGGVLLGAGVALGIGSYFVFTRDRGQGTVMAPALGPTDGGVLLGAGGRF